MNYAELIAKALNGRSVNSVAKAWGLNQPTLSRYVRGDRMPDYVTGLRIAKEAGVDPGEAFEVFATQERISRVKNFKLQMGFVQITILALLIALSGSATVYIM